MCEQVERLSPKDKFYDGLLDHELELLKEGRLDLVLQSIRERMNCRFGRAAEIYFSWKVRTEIAQEKSGARPGGDPGQAPGLREENIS